MKTWRSILSEVAGYLVELSALAALLTVSLTAVRGLLVTVAAAAVAVSAHLGALRPRLVHWGATASDPFSRQDGKTQARRDLRVK
jgi:hypothetical protein